MTATVLRWTAIVLNAWAALWWFGYAMAWGPNDYIGGTVAAIPPISAVVALTWGRKAAKKR